MESRAEPIESDQRQALRLECINAPEDIFYYREASKDYLISLGWVVRKGPGTLSDDVKAALVSSPVSFELCFVASEDSKTSHVDNIVPVKEKLDQECLQLKNRKDGEHLTLDSGALSVLCQFHVNGTNCTSKKLRPEGGSKRLIQFQVRASIPDCPALCEANGSPRYFYSKSFSIKSKRKHMDLSKRTPEIEQRKKHCAELQSLMAKYLPAYQLKKTLHNEPGFVVHLAEIYPDFSVLDGMRPFMPLHAEGQPEIKDITESRHLSSQNDFETLECGTSMCNGKRGLARCGCTQNLKRVKTQIAQLKTNLERIADRIVVLEQRRSLQGEQEFFFNSNSDLLLDGTEDDSEISLPVD